MLKAVHLHGAAAERFGRKFRVDVRDTAEAVRALCQLPGFHEFFQSADWRIVRGKLARGNEIREDLLRLAIGSAGGLHLVPLKVI